MTKTTATPTDEIAALDARLGELDQESRRLGADRDGAKHRHQAARSHVVTIRSFKLAGEDVTDELAKAEKAEAKARAEAQEAADRDWDAELAAVDGATRKVQAQRAQAIATNAVPLVDELVPGAEQVNARILDLAEQLEAAITTHGHLLRKAEAVLHHLDFYDPRRDIPCRGDEFADLSRALDRLQHAGAPWPLPDLRRPPFKLQSLGTADQEAWTPPAGAEAA